MTFMPLLHQWPSLADQSLLLKTWRQEPARSQQLHYFLLAFRKAAQAYLVKQKSSYCWNCLPDWQKPFQDIFGIIKSLNERKLCNRIFLFEVYCSPFWRPHLSFSILFGMYLKRKCFIFWRAVGHKETSPSIRLVANTRTIEALFLQNC